MTQYVTTVTVEAPDGTHVPRAALEAIQAACHLGREVTLSLDGVRVPVYCRDSADDVWDRFNEAKRAQ